VNVWINGRATAMLNFRDRGLQYGDGVFETMRVRKRKIRLLDFHLERLYGSCRRLKIAAPGALKLRRELKRIAGRRSDGILKLIVTRGAGPRGYRPSGRERCTRIATLHPLPGSMAAEGSRPARLRVCATPLGINPLLAGLKTLNRLESVMARAEWTDERIWEGLMLDVDGYCVCGTMSNLFLRRGTTLMTPLLDRCGVAGVMRRWVLQSAGELRLRVAERRIRWQDLAAAEEVFMSNAVVGIRSVRSIESAHSDTLRFTISDTARLLRRRLELL
jgi:4-amino-4-deoxychorismate lyase